MSWHLKPIIPLFTKRSKIGLIKHALIIFRGLPFPQIAEWKKRTACAEVSRLVKTEQEGHHRPEKRLVWAVPLSEFGGLYKQGQWSGLQTIVMVERTRHLWNKVTHEVQFYLSSLPADAQNLGNAIRTHWGIEKRCDPARVSRARERAPRHQVHWTLDVTFSEDHCRIRSCHAPRNFALLRRMALNALNLETTLKRSHFCDSWFLSNAISNLADLLATVEKRYN